VVGPARTVRTGSGPDSQGEGAAVTSEPDDPNSDQRELFFARLEQLWQKAGNPAPAWLVHVAGLDKKSGEQRISDWRNGKHVPRNEVEFDRLVRALIRRVPAPSRADDTLCDTTQWVMLRKAAASSHRRRSPRRQTQRQRLTDGRTHQAPDASPLVGRGAEIGILIEYLRRPKSSRDGVILTVDGMAGVGKSALALHVASLVRADYPEAVYIDLRAHTADQRPYRPDEATEVLLSMLEPPIAELPADPEARAACWRTWAARRRILLVLDNADSAAQVRPLLPAPPGRTVLITSRARLVDLEGAVPLSLRPLSEAEAFDLLKEAARQGDLQPEEAAEVVRLCGYLPLAIKVAATWLLHHPARTVRDLQEEFDVTQGAVSAALAVSYRSLKPSQRRLLRRLSLHPGRTLTVDAVAALGGVDRGQAKRGVETLYVHHLLDEPERGRYKFHDSVRIFLREVAERDEPPASRRQARERLLNHYLAVLGEREDRRVEWTTAELENLLASAEYAAEEDLVPYAWTLPRALAVTLQMRGAFTLARNIHERALRVAERHGDVGGQAAARIELVVVTRQSGLVDLASDHCAKALQLAERGGDRLQQAACWAEFGVLTRDAGDLSAARRHFGQAAALYKELDRPIGQANIDIALSDLERRAGDQRLARQYAERAGSRYISAGSVLGEADALAALARIAQAEGRDVEAVASLQQALHLYLQIDDRFGAAAVNNHLADLAIAAQDNASAERYLHAARQLYQSMGMAESAAVETRIDSLGRGEDPAAPTARTTGDRHGSPPV
jgi:tetratricopeptide (TPR) repeat protein